MAPAKERELILAFEENLKKNKIGVWEWSDEEEEEEEDKIEDLDLDWVLNHVTCIIYIIQLVIFDQIKPEYLAFGLIYFRAASSFV